MAAEGTADYFAAKDCSKDMFGPEIYRNSLARNTVDAASKSWCERVYTDTNEQNLCFKTMNAGKELGSLLGSSDPTLPTVGTPDYTVVTTTYERHPNSQCRVDTYRAGAICTKRQPKIVIPGIDSLNDLRKAELISNKFSCEGPGAYSYNYKPRCWYKPRFH